MPLFPHNPVRVFIAAQSGEFSMPWRPFLKLDLRDDDRRVGEAANRATAFSPTPKFKAQLGAARANYRPR
jgi:hypothetical protein